MDSSLQT
jgi:hypothetical protein